MFPQSLLIPQIGKWWVNLTTKEQNYYAGEKGNKYINAIKNEQLTRNQHIHIQNVKQTIIHTILTDPFKTNGLRQTWI